MPGRFGVDVGMFVYVLCVCVSVCPPLLLITSSMIWTLCDWLNNFCFFSVSNLWPVTEYLDPHDIWTPRSEYFRNIWTPLK